MTDFRVPYLDRRQIHRHADRMRRKYPSICTIAVDIIRFLELELYNYGEIYVEVTEDRQMDGKLGQACIINKVIMLPRTSYLKAIDGDTQARFTIAHEIAHIELHSGRMMEPIFSIHDAKPTRRAEWQANELAAEILVPRDSLRFQNPIAEEARRFGVSPQVIKYRRVNLKETYGSRITNPDQFVLI